jgi:hypothetical protein
VNNDCFKKKTPLMILYTYLLFSATHPRGQIWFEDVDIAVGFNHCHINEIQYSRVVHLEKIDEKCFLKLWICGKAWWVWRCYSGYGEAKLECGVA